MKKDEKESEPTDVFAEKLKKPRTLVSGAKFHDFDAEPVFTGKFEGETVLAENDDEKANRSKGDLMGFIFLNEEGEQVIIGANHSVEKAMSMGVVAGDVISFKFLGKEQTASGKPFSRFKIDLL